MMAARDFWMPCVAMVGLVALFLLVRLALVVADIRRNRRRRQQQTLSSKPVPVLIVLGSGGHTTEMLFMTKHLNAEQYRPIHYCKASTDSTSHDRLMTMMKEMKVSTTNVTIHDIPRSREVGQSYVSSIFTTLYAFYYAFALVGRLRPQLILCNGPGTCIPICVAALWFRIVSLIHSNIVFVESYCRVQTLSLTGKLLYHVADLFLVHWPELRDKYPDTVLTKSFIQS